MPDSTRQTQVVDVTRHMAKRTVDTKGGYGNTPHNQ